MYVIELTCFDVDAKQTTVTHAISKFKNLRADAAWIHWPKRTDGTFFFHDQNGRPYFSTSGISWFIHRFSALKYKHQFKNQLSPAKLETFQCEHKYRISARQLISLPHLFFFLFLLRFDNCATRWFMRGLVKLFFFPSSSSDLFETYGRKLGKRNFWVFVSIFHRKRPSPFHKSFVYYKHTKSARLLSFTSIDNKTPLQLENEFTSHSFQWME